VDKESYFIDQFNIRKNLKDDGAYIDGFVYSKDSFFEDVHFKKDWLSIYQIAQKAMLINISDAIVMNAKPKYALLSVAIPIYFTKKQLSQLAKGFKDIANRYNIEIIGGDTIGNSKLDITITLISKTTKPIFRTGLKEGFLLGYTGNIGEVGKDLAKVFENKKLNKKSKFIKPILRDNFFIKPVNI